MDNVEIKVDFESEEMFFVEIDLRKIIDYFLHLAEHVAFQYLTIFQFLIKVEFQGDNEHTRELSWY